MSHIAIIGATGRAGSQLLEEALRRGHTVTAIARKASTKLAGRANVKAIDLDVLDGAALEKVLAGHDAVFSAAHFATVPPAAIIEPTKRAGVKRLLVVGGAGSLFAAPGLKVIDTPNFPDAYRAEASAGGVFLDTLRNEKDLDWTFLSPSAEFLLRLIPTAMAYVHVSVYIHVYVYKYTYVHVCHCYAKKPLGGVKNK